MEIIEFPDKKQRVETWPEKAAAVVVSDDVSYNAAAELLIGIKALRTEVADAYDGLIASAHKHHKDLIAKKKEYDDPLDRAEQTIKATMGTYLDDCKRREDADRKKREEEQRKIDEAKALETAAALETEGKRTGDATMVVEAAAIVEEQIKAPAPAVAPVRFTPKVGGISVRKPEWVYDRNTVDVKALIKHCAEHPDDWNLLTPNFPAIAAVVKATAGSKKIGGVRIYQTGATVGAVNGRK